MRAEEGCTNLGSVKGGSQCSGWRWRRDNELGWRWPLGPQSSNLAFLFMGGSGRGRRGGLALAYIHIRWNILMFDMLYVFTQDRFVFIIFDGSYMRPNYKSRIIYNGWHLWTVVDPNSHTWRVVPHNHILNVLFSWDIMGRFLWCLTYDPLPMSVSRSSVRSDRHRSNSALLTINQPAGVRHSRWWCRIIWWIWLTAPADKARWAFM